MKDIFSCIYLLANGKYTLISINFEMDGFALKMLNLKDLRANATVFAHETVVFAQMRPFSVLGYTFHLLTLKIYPICLHYITGRMLTRSRKRKFQQDNASSDSSGLQILLTFHLPQKPKLKRSQKERKQL